MSIEQHVLEIIAEQLSINSREIAPDARLIDDLGADSLDSMEIVMQLEEKFGVSIDDGELEQCRTVKDLCELVISKKL